MNRESTAKTEMTVKDQDLDVLIVEDERHIARFLEVILMRQGYRVGVAHNANSAIRCLERQSCRALVLDLGLPDRSGLELISEVNRLGWEKSPKILILTGLSVTDEQMNSLRQFADHVSSKPISPSSLFSKLCQLGVHPCQN